MKRLPSGQVALLLILLLTVVSAVVLSSVSGVVTNLRLTRTDEESSQALRVAESGVEESLRTLSNTSGSLEGVTYSVGQSQEGINGFLTAEDVIPGEVLEVNVSNITQRPDDIDIYWGDTSDPVENPYGAIEVIRYRKSSNSDYSVDKWAFDPNATRRSINLFQAPNRSAKTWGGVSFANRTRVGIGGNDLIVRIKVLYNQQRIGIEPLPTGKSLGSNPYRRVVSTAQTTTGVVRKIEAIRTEATLPLIFDMALYSGGDLSQ